MYPCLQVLVGHRLLPISDWSRAHPRHTNTYLRDTSVVQFSMHTVFFDHPIQASTTHTLAHLAGFTMNPSQQQIFDQQLAAGKSEPYAQAFASKFAEGEVGPAS